MRFLYDLPSTTGRNMSQGAEQTLLYAVEQVPILIPLILTAIFLVVLISGFNSQRRREGNGNFPQWFAIAGFLTSIIAIMMGLVEGLIAVPTIITVVAITIAGMLWFFLSR